MSQATPDLYPSPVTDPTPEPPRTTVSDGPSLLARAAAELFGTFVLVLAGLGTALFSSYSGAGTLGVALAFGFGAIVAILAIGQISGGHLNPAVTLGSAIAGRTRWSLVLPYWLAQIIGAALASSVLFLVLSAFEPFAGTERTLFSGLANGYDIYTPLVRTTDTASQIVGLNLTGTLVLEALLTAVLVGVVLAVTDPRRDARSARTAPLAIGMTLTFGLLISIPLTNGSLNPARSLAAALYSDTWAWGQLWVFIVAPLVGAAIAGLVYLAFASGSADEIDLADLDDLDDEIDLDDASALDGTSAPTPDKVEVDAKPALVPEKVEAPEEKTDVAVEAPATKKAPAAKTKAPGTGAPEAEATDGGTPTR